MGKREHRESERTLRHNEHGSRRTDELLKGTPSEKQFYLTARRRGYTVLRNGFPDFVLIDTRGRITLVEVKRAHWKTPTSNQKYLERQMTSMQKAVAFVLYQAGFEYYLSDGVTIGLPLSHETFLEGRKIFHSQLKAWAKVSPSLLAMGRKYSSPRNVRIFRDLQLKLV